jgi:cholesterol transport system auxiliary component
MRLWPLLLVAAACGPIVQVGNPAPPPAALLTLTATTPASVPAGIQPVAPGEGVSILAAAAPAALQTLRIPVLISDTEIQYVKDGQWAEPPARLFNRLLADTLVAAGMPIIDRAVTGRAAPMQLGGTLSLFHVDVRSGRRVVVRYDATLKTPKGLLQRRFERDAPLGATDGPTAARALNIAANAVAADVASWISTSRPR